MFLLSKSFYLFSSSQKDVKNTNILKKPNLSTNWNIYLKLSVQLCKQLTIEFCNL